MGNMKDEAGVLTLYPQSTNVTEAIASSFLNATIYAENENLFPTPTGSNATLDTFNVTVHFATDAMARCADQAFAHAGAQNKTFPSVWYYEFERGYQPADFELNRPVCDAPVDAGHPYGDPAKPYFK
jgi:hypothetical protein